MSFFCHLLPKKLLTPRDLKYVSGFSLIELMVSIAVLTIVTTGALVNYSNFQSDVKLKNTAHEVAVSIRKAQIYGMSVREFQGGFQYSYGVHFSGDSPDSYILFADANGNNTYDGASEAVEQFNLNRNFKIGKFCGDTSCWPGSITRLDIVFERPTPGVVISTGVASNYEKAEIYVESPNSGNQVGVFVNLTGQVFVES